MKVKKTERGFELIEFEDIYGEKCSLQASSLASDGLKPGATAVWFGCEEAKTHHVTGQPLSPRMHLDRKLAKELVTHLHNWLKTGSFK